MNEDQGLNDREESKAPSALVRNHSEPIKTIARDKKEHGFAGRGARDPVMGIPVNGMPNQIVAGIPVFRTKQPSGNSSVPRT